MQNKSQATDLPQLFQSINWEGENTLGYKLRRIIFEAVLQVVGDKIRMNFDFVKIEHPKVENYGDYSTNIALMIAGKIGTKPRDLAEKIANELNNYIKRHQSITSLTDSLSLPDKSKPSKITNKSPKTVGEILENASVAGPGFVNLTIRKDYLSTLIQGVLNIKEPVISSRNDMPATGLPLAGKKIMVEFAHPNTHKEFHIGHLRNISIGESVIRNLEAVGAQLFRANYEGDVGLHVAKAIWGVREKMKEGRGSDLQDVKGLTPTFADLRELNPANKAKFLGEGYALGNKMYEENESVKKEIIDLNIAIYKDPKKVELWEETRRWSLEYFETVYHRVGSRFDRYFFESEVEGRGKQMVINGAKKGIFIKDKDGSIYFPGEKYGLNNCVFVTKENYATYEGKDVALESLEFEEFPFDVDIHVVAHEQRNFFQIAFKALEVIDPNQKGRQFHLAYGMVNLKGGKLSSRTGQVITADWLIDEAKKKILKIIKQSSNRAIEQLNSKEAEQTAEKVAVSAVKYSVLKVNPKIDIAFDLEESVSLEGDSGPYLMYTYARCKSVLRKAKSANFQFPISNFKLNTEELSILRTLYRFPEVVIEAARTLSPNLICTFLFDLAQKYNLFYNKHSILNATIEQSNNETMKKKDTNQDLVNFRLALTQATSIILNRGLYLLGIETVERM